MNRPAEFLREKWWGWREWEDRIILAMRSEGLSYREIVFAGNLARTARAVEDRLADLRPNCPQVEEEFARNRGAWLVHDREEQ